LNNQLNSQNNLPPTETNNDAFGDIDFGKIFSILRRSLIWVILINGLTLFIAYTYLRYYKPIYSSSSSLKLSIKNANSIQGIYAFGGENNDNVKELLGEIELIRSDLIIEEVIKLLELNISYHAQGNFIDSELYPEAPFEVKIELKNNSFYDKKIGINFLNDKKCEIGYEENNIEIKKIIPCDKFIKLPHFKIKVSPSANIGESINQAFYVIVNSKGSLINYIRKNLNAGITKQEARIVEINFTDNSQKKAQAIVDTVVKAYMKKSIEEKNKSNRQQISFLNDQLKQYEDSLIVYESQLQNFFLENKTKDIDQKLEKAIEEIEKFSILNQEFAKKLSLLRELETLMKREADLKEFLPILPQLEIEIITQNVNKIQELLKEKEILKLAENVDKNNTFRAKKLNIEIGLVKEAIDEIISSNKKILYKEIREINAKKIEIENSLIGLPTKGRQYNRISRLYEQYTQYYNTFLNKRTEIRILEAGVVPEFIILSPANLPSEPIAPIKYQFYAIAGVAGLFLSLALIAIRYLMHNTLATQPELEKLVRAPVLGSVPEYRRAKLKYTKLVVGQNPKSSINEALRSIRTNLDFMLPTGKGIYNQNGSVVISITSTISGEGKTFVASNLGGIIAMSDLKVVILDFDMRKPKLHIAFDAENTQGVSSILIGKKTIEDCIQPTEINNLFFISSGPTPPNPSELILREDFDMLVEDLKKKFDVIMIDTPPVGLVTDGILIMQKVDMPLYVVKANYSKRMFTKNINRLVESNNFTNLAVILNAVKKTGTGYGYGYGYGGYYEDEPKISLYQKITQRWFKSKKEENK
jgi:capsular exopolysaccharide synthesis family protein